MVLGFYGTRKKSNKPKILQNRDLFLKFASLRNQMTIDSTSLDDFDRRILDYLQRDNQISNQTLAAEIGLSPPACLRRVKRLREEKYIQQDISVLDPAKMGLPLMMLVLVQVERERVDLLDEFKRFVKAMPEVMQCYVVTGRADFVLMISVRDVEHYDEFSTRVFRQNQNIRHFETMVVMSRVKVGLSLPLEISGTEGS